MKKKSDSNDNKRITENHTANRIANDCVDKSVKDTVTDNSKGTNIHIRKKYKFSVDKNDKDIPVAVYHDKKELKKTKEKKKKSKGFKIFVGIGTTLLSLLLVVCITLSVLLVVGKNSMIGDNVDTQVTVPSNVTVEGEYVIYNGEKYLYNNKVTTILFAGIDKHTDEHINGVLGTAGQADSIFVMALNTETGKYKLMSISRDTMVDVNVCDAAGNFKGTEKMQICLAHAYGDGDKTSNENLKRSVSRLFFGIPVNSYMSIDLDAIPVLNDAVGGVNVTVIEDLSNYDPALTKGANVTLNGEQAETYVRSRDITGDANQNDLRMERQKSYINSFIQQTLSMTKQDIKTPVNLYNAIAPYTRTDIDASEVTYLASIFLKSGFSADENYIKVPGEAVAGEIYAEYYTDTDAFFEIILDTYYTKVE